MRSWATLNDRTDAIFPVAARLLVVRPSANRPGPPQPAPRCLKDPPLFGGPPPRGSSWQAEEPVEMESAKHWSSRVPRELGHGHGLVWS